MPSCWRTVVTAHVSLVMLSSPNFVCNHSNNYDNCTGAFCLLALQGA